MNKATNKASSNAKDEYQYYFSGQSNDKRQARNRKKLKRIFRRAVRRVDFETEL